MKTIHVNASKSYDILIERGILDRAGEEIKTVCGAGEALIVSDDTVWDLYGETVLASMQKAGFDVTSFTFPHGEQSKNLSVYADILNALAARHLSRKGLVVALGGGVVGDMAGFAAATYLRGVRFVQIPTTLLSRPMQLCASATTSICDLNFGIKRSAMESTRDSAGMTRPNR